MKKTLQNNRNNQTAITDQETLKSIWLGRRFLNRTFSMQEDDPIVDVEEIRELFDEEIKEGGSE